MSAVESRIHTPNHHNWPGRIKVAAFLSAIGLAASACSGEGNPIDAVLGNGNYTFPAGTAIRNTPVPGGTACDTLASDYTAVNPALENGPPGTDFKFAAVNLVTVPHHTQNTCVPDGKNEFEARIYIDLAAATGKR